MEKTCETFYVLLHGFMFCCMGTELLSRYYLQVVFFSIFTPYMNKSYKNICRANWKLYTQSLNSTQASCAMFLQKLKKPTNYDWNPYTSLQVECKYLNFL